MGKAPAAARRKLNITPYTHAEREAMADIRVLIVEDDAYINHIVATHLSRCGYACTQAFSGTEARLLLEAALTKASVDHSASFNVVICDLMLPGMTGEELVALIRQRDASVPIVVTSARTAASDKIDLLKLGADDYLAKPFDLDELVARIEVQLRHRKQTVVRDSDAASAPHRTLVFRSWELDPEARTFTAHGAEIELSRIDFNIMELLMRRPRRVFSKQELFEQAWGEPYAADDNTVNVHVSNIRGKLKGSGTEGYIKTVWGMGFKLVEE